MTNTAHSPLLLMQALGRPLGRSTLLEQATEEQLLGRGGSLVNRFCRLYDQVSGEMRHLLGLPHDLPERRPHPWSLLTEPEHPAWALLALSQPPVLGPAATAHAARHLLSAHKAMPAPRCQQWALGGGGLGGGGLAGGSNNRDPFGDLLGGLAAQLPSLSLESLTWAQLLVILLTVQAHHAMLPLWGVLSAHMGLNSAYRVQAIADLLAELTVRPELVEDTDALAAATLWATLRPLHGGLPQPETSQPGTTQIVALTQALRGLSERSWNAPVLPAAQLWPTLRQWLPALSDQDLVHLRTQMLAPPAADFEGQNPQTGLALIQQPGQVAYWLRRPGQVQIVACSLYGPEQSALGHTLALQSWQWPIAAGLSYQENL